MSRRVMIYQRGDSSIVHELYATIHEPVAITRTLLIAHWSTACSFDASLIAHYPLLVTDYPVSELWPLDYGPTPRVSGLASNLMNPINSTNPMNSRKPTG